jgi:hypothetical protein
MPDALTVIPPHRAAECDGAAHGPALCNSSPSRTTQMNRCSGTSYPESIISIDCGEICRPSSA